MPHIKKKTRNDERKKYNRLQLINCLESIFNESSSISICMYPVNWIEYVKSTCFPPPLHTNCRVPVAHFLLDINWIAVMCNQFGREKKGGKKKHFLSEAAMLAWWNSSTRYSSTFFYLFWRCFLPIWWKFNNNITSKKEFHSLDSIYWKSLF